MSDGLDPTISNSNCSGLLRGQLANPLVEEGPGGMLIPELAESWESSKDVKKWTFKLRKGIGFHNGKTFDATEAELPRRAYDPDKARYHLKIAGLESHTFTLHVADAPYAGAVELQTP